ncbi:MAG: hypothetical protein ABFS12_02870, partial [Bacteroidota bacterium]
MSINIVKQFLISILFLVIVVSPQHTLGQWNFSLSTSQEFNSNPFRSVTPYSDFISTYELGIEREFDQLNILYYGSYNSFIEASDISYYWHQIGLYKENEHFTWGAYFEQRINKELNNYFDY